MIDEPPFVDGAVQDTIDEAFANEVAVTDVGTPGTVGIGVAGFERKDEFDVPIALRAWTVNV